MEPMYSHDGMIPLPHNLSETKMPPPEAKKALDAPTAAMSLLRSMGWVRARYDFDADRNPRPLLLRGDCKCVVGKAWVTFWVLEAPEQISQPRSARTDDLTQVRKESLLHGGNQPL